MPIDYGLLDTTIPPQIGALPGNTLATFLQRKQQMEERAVEREEAGTRNALARLQLQRGQRDMAEEDAYRNALAGIQGGDYAAAMPDLMKASPTRALALKKSMAEEQKSGLETTLKRFELVDRTAAQFAANPTRQTGVWVLSQLAANGTPPEVIREMSAKLNAARDEDIPQMAQAFLAATREGAKAKIDAMFPKPGTPSTLGRLIAERLRKNIERNTFLKSENLSLKLTASFGIACYPQHAGSKEDLIRLADEAMYRVKYHSRNSVYVVEP